MERSSIPISVRFPAEIKDNLQKASKDARMSQNNYIIKAVEEKIKREK